MLNELTIAYLFLGGIGAGCIGVCSLLDLVILREPFGCEDYAQGPSVRYDRRIVDYSFALGFVVLATGVLCLVFDLGRVDRIVNLFIYPTLTWMSFGAYTLLGLCIFSAFLAIVRFMYLPQFKRMAIIAAEVTACVLSAATMVYTGFLLETLRSSALWMSVWLPLLFAASSISGGIALVVLSSTFVTKDHAAEVLLKKLMIADLIAIVAEILFAFFFILSSGMSSNPGTALGLANLLSGKQAILWWYGFILCGLVLPLVAETLSLFVGHMGKGSDSKFLNTVFCICAVSVIIGAACMRTGMIEAGESRTLELQDPQTLTLEAEEASDVSNGTLEGQSL